MFTEETTSKYLKQILQAMNYLHDNSIIHRDLKPENILLCFGKVKIADFGASVHAPETSRKRRTFVGTIEYVPPEMVKGDKYDYHIDNWSLGILTYEFLAGQSPFGKLSRTETLNSILCSKIVIPEHFSAEATSFIKNLLNPNPKNRMEMSAALNHPFIQMHNPK